MDSKKLLERIRIYRNNVKFSDARKLVEDLGFSLKNIEGDHYIFSSPKCPRIIDIQPDKNKDAKAYQLKQIRELVDEYNLKLED